MDSPIIEDVLATKKYNFIHKQNMFLTEKIISSICIQVMIHIL